MIYLDNNATTGVDPLVREAMWPYLGEAYGNPSSMHRFGQEARQAVELGRRQVAGLVGCDVRELVFMSGGTEADNAAIMGMVFAEESRRDACVTAEGSRRDACVTSEGGGRDARVTGRKNVIVTSTVEHSAVREVLGGLRKRGFEVVEIGVDVKGSLDVEGLEKILRERAKEVLLVTIMWANNETGVLFDVRGIGEICRRYGVVFHVDGVQAVGKVLVELKGLPVDLMSLSGHKFHGAKGVGALFVRRGVRWQAFVRGGPQERERRGGTENVAGIVGMGVAAEMARAAVLDGGTLERVRVLRDRLEAGILERVPESFVNGDVGKRVVNTTNIGFAGLEAEAILILLSEAGICASAGAACASGSLEPSHVLRAMGVAERVAHGAVRFSLSRMTREEDVAGCLEVLPGVVRRLRETLPV